MVEYTCIPVPPAWHTSGTATWYSTRVPWYLRYCTMVRRRLPWYYSTIWSLQFKLQFWKRRQVRSALGKRVSTDARRRRTRTHVLLRILWAAAAAAAAAAGDGRGRRRRRRLRRPQRLWRLAEAAAQKSARYMDTQPFTRCLVGGTLYSKTQG